MKNILKIIPLLVLVISCASPKISNLEKGRYRYEESAPTNILDVSVSMLPISSPEPVILRETNFLDIRDSLPHIYMKVLASKIDNADTFISSLSKPILPKPKDQDVKKQTNYTYHKVQFVFNNLKKYYNDKRLMHPNTRLEFLTTYVSLPPNSVATFYNINKLQNEFEEIDLGSLSRDQTVALNAKLNVSGGLGGSYENNSGNTTNTNSFQENGREKTVYDDNGNIIGFINNKGTFTSVHNDTSSKKTGGEAKVSATLEGSYQNSETIKEAMAVKLKRLNTGFNFSDRKLAIAQRGRVSGDISDNIYVTTVLKISNTKNVFSIPAYSFDNLYDEQNEPMIADKLIFKKREVSFVPCDSAQNIDLSISYEGAIRAVRNLWLNSGSNALEFDDKVTYYKINNSSADSLSIDKNEYCKDVYKFVAEDFFGNFYTLKIADPNHGELDIFIDDDPKLFRQWMIDNLENMNVKSLESSRFTLYFQKNGERGNIIPFVKKNLTSEDLKKIQSIKNIEIKKRNP